MFLSLYTYDYRPKNIDVHDYIHKGSLNKVLFAIDCIIKSGTLPILKDALIAQENNDFFTKLASFKIQEHQYNNGSLEEYLFVEAKRNIDTQKQKYQDRILYYSTLTPDLLKQDFISNPTTTDYRLINILKQNISRNVGKPLFDLNQENRRVDFYDNPFVLEAFQRSFNKTFIMGHTLLPVTKDRINDVYNILNSLILDKSYLKNEKEERSAAKEDLDNLEELKYESDDTLFLISVQTFPPESD